MSQIDSRTAQKFVVRFDNDSTRVKVQKASDEVHISMNAFILQAIDEKLERGRCLDVLLQQYVKSLL